ncbi:MAG: SWIM zinc finger family protein [Pseudomonadota bacterium]
MKTTIFAKSSSQQGLAYAVNISIDDRVFRIDCACPAGTHGLLCKHIISILNGNKGILFDPTQGDELAEITHIISKSEIMKDFLAFNSQRLEIEKEQRALKEQLRVLKLDFTMKMTHGIKL